MNAQRKGWIVLGIRVYLLVWELTGNLTKPFSPWVWKQRQGESEVAAKKGGLGEEEVEGEDRKI